MRFIRSQVTITASDGSEWQLQVLGPSTSEGSNTQVTLVCLAAGDGDWPECDQIRFDGLEWERAMAFLMVSDDGTEAVR